ncbi:NAD(P)/FAD-dependent oxidoreductase [Roseovarius rhodophyticola]|uniref:FAD-binding oxidoreductase n=1 Tax=Roseovarius rhodophyticola TaxID=3080827 RepID=A0ABZ2TN05_9RHOB|nr:FAD-binding oxidoreductase [Roseovarius sp. W115]MDV2929495.1 FAD-binding oxidoreductase [Roseovarius sp. W115]
MKVAVIGAGMIGSAAARHLSKLGHEVCLIGPDEPREKKHHKGVFASHYDAGRITRTLDPDPFWARASADSIARYGDIQAESGIPFYTECGLLMAGPSGHPAITKTQALAIQESYEFQSYSAGALSSRFPDFSFDASTHALFEPKGAGYIDPRALVAAQIAIAQNAGATRALQIANGVRETASGVEIETEDRQFTADQVLVAAGGFSNMVLSEPLPITVMARTILMVEVEEREAERLTGLPPVIQYFGDGTDMYLLPPIKYPDGRYYIKLGGDPSDVVLGDIGQIKKWFRQGGDGAVGGTLDEILTTLMPSAKLGSRYIASCVTTFSEDQRPILKRLSDRVSVATAGCGRGAKCSDELGRLGAVIALGHDLPVWVDVARPKASGL